MPESPSHVWSYAAPEGVGLVFAGRRPALTTPQGGRVIVDRRMLKLWRAASGQTLDQLAAWGPRNGWRPTELHAALACLAEAGLLQRLGLPVLAAAPVSDPMQTTGGNLVSAVIVGYNSRDWLSGCLESLRAQTWPAIETLLVDNGSSDGSAEWVAQNHPQVRLLAPGQGGSLAAAINAGFRAAHGRYLLVLNPDVVLAPDAVEQMVAAAEKDPGAAAVAAKLRLMWAPAFLNGLGNFVGSFAYGADCGLGHLDLGQFDDWETLPSACFAAALLPRLALEMIGPLDEGFPMYYEDSEWCYRARLFGYRVLPAPKALVFHAFSGRTADEPALAPEAPKLRRIGCGRLRFSALLLEPAGWARFHRRYRSEDWAAAILAHLRLQPQRAQAYRRAWQDYRTQLPGLLERRALLQARRCRTDAELFAEQRRTPPPRVWRGLPLLTWDVIAQSYLPWLCGPSRSRFPEMAGLTPEDIAARRNRSPGQRLLSVWQDEGAAAVLHRLGKYLQWKLQMDV